MFRFCWNSSLLECSLVTHAARDRFPAEICLSLAALVEDGDDLGQVLIVSTLLIFPSWRRTGCTSREWGAATRKPTKLK
jgi:hypothetical protein